MTRTINRELFDLERIRRNWQRGDEPRVVEPPERLGHVEPPGDVFGEGQRLLLRLRAELAEEFPAQRETLALFVARLEAVFVELRDAQTPDAAPALREEFMAILYELEDLCEAVLGATR